MEKKINIELCKFSKELIDEIVFLQKENVTLISENSLKDYIKYNSNLDILYIAKYENKIIGFLIAKNLIDVIDLEYILVDSKYLKKGIASLLLNKLCEYAKENNIFNIMLEVRISNTPAICLYQKHNFLIINKREKYYKDTSEDALIMQKQIK